LNHAYPISCDRESVLQTLEALDEAAGEAEPAAGEVEERAEGEADSGGDEEEASAAQVLAKYPSARILPLFKKQARPMEEGIKDRASENKVRTLLRCGSIQ